MYYGAKTNTDSIRTPQHILTWVRDTFGDYFDPCPFNPGFDKNKHTDGRTIEWKPVTYVNPPYSIGYQFLKKCYTEIAAQHSNVIVFLGKLDLLGRKAFNGGCDIVLFRNRIIFPPFDKPPRFLVVMLVFHPTSSNTVYFYEDLTGNEFNNNTQ